MRIYISGAITGTSDYMERFNNAHKYLESLGYSVINPALVNSNLPDDTTYNEYMAMSFTMLDMCDHIYLLKGYEKSKGARMELNRAKTRGLKILTEYTPTDLYPKEIYKLKQYLNNKHGLLEELKK